MVPVCLRRFMMLKACGPKYTPMLRGCHDERQADSPESEPSLTRRERAFDRLRPNGRMEKGLFPFVASLFPVRGEPVEPQTTDFAERMTAGGVR